MLKRILFSLAIVFIAASYLQAQVTTSSVTGNVIDAATKEPLVGASHHCNPYTFGHKIYCLIIQKR